ncbi:hypothetical protein CAPTEDRAFT_223413 [Capitella teleta]|uniref:GPI alpha-1,4-mannosyltransferase I, catalytic subunit n=1 Tax=Capitella teleta TaxID=283909 RepID=R7UFS0_CAPTE|nr:hypothetical protein CAPTEDRAFT_223413 [Capitella teleta]|eukprot:ELU02643.1 hypothetical protein CAPTEDRAFT_223413 [Capitella teleta]
MEPASLLPSIIFAGLVRVMLMLYGLWHDANFTVKYTDVDYYVFTDAASHVIHGESPYSRATYRYTPLLAWALAPNIYVHPCFGKVIFIVCDILAAVLIHKILRSQSCSAQSSVFCAQLWLFNPITITVSTRGNAESVMSVLVLIALHYFTKNTTLQSLVVASVTYAISVHVKIFPATYAVAIYFYVNSKYFNHQPVFSVMPNRYRVLAGVIGATTFAVLTGLCYLMYGYEFLHETYLYHVIRQDTRHNFSAYFYLFYLLPDVSWLSAAVFVPQLFLILLSSYHFYEDLIFTCFINTFVFVTFNKVCTSQYFLWYLTILPLIVPYLHMSLKRVICLTSLWFLCQVLWLTPAYQLEFEGKDTFLFIWIASLVFFAVNVFIIGNIVQFYDFRPNVERKSREMSEIGTVIREIWQKRKHL